jgi:hypothetical protein
MSSNYVLKSTKALNILCISSGWPWGADRVYLLCLYHALVGSVLDYGSIVYASAAPSTLRPLNTIHHSCIRLSTGAYETSHIESLLVEAGEPPLQKRRDILLGSYAAKLLGILHYPAWRAVLQPSFMTSYDIRQSLPRPAGIRFLHMLKNLNIGLPRAVQYSQNTIPPWKLLWPVFDLRLTALSKLSTSPIIYQRNFRELMSLLPHLFYHLHRWLYQGWLCRLCFYISGHQS